jgi:hypothetical protein
MNAEEILAGGASLALSPGDRDLLSLLRTADRDEARGIWSKWSDEHPLDSATSRELRVLPAVTERLLALDVDDPNLGRLRGIARFHWLWTQHATRASLEAAAALSARGVQVVALKGLALHALGILSRAQRPITDGDLLVSGELDHACSVLEPLGFSVQHRYLHAWTCVRGPQEEIDLHRFPIHLDSRSGDWTFAAVERPGGAPFHVPSHAHLLLHACLHGVRKWSGSVLWVIDVARIIATGGVDWGKLVELARARRLSLALADALGVVGDLVPKPVLRELLTLRVSALEALEYVSATGCLAGPWMASASRATQAMRDLRKAAAVVDDRALTRAERRLGLPWRSEWPGAWQRREPRRIWAE